MTSYPTAKRILDKAISLALLVVLSPLFAFSSRRWALTCWFVARDRGAWLYRERRISRGREFDLLKFRTLRRRGLEQHADGESHARLLRSG